MRENVLPILDAYGVDLVMGGHSHSYERSFPLYGHYGTSDTLAPEMILDDGDGNANGDGVYQKDDVGTVYIVAGSSGKRSSIFVRGSLDHPAMYISKWERGSVVLDVDGDALTARFLDDDGSVDDEFTILKSMIANAPPEVDAGPDLVAVIGEMSLVRGVVVDDGLPVAPGVTEAIWSTESGPAQAVFADPRSPETSVVFSAAGTYVLTLIANDGTMFTSDRLEAFVYPEGTVNQAPTVNAGDEIRVVLPMEALLTGSVADDGLPTSPHQLSVQWTFVSGPSIVSFDEPTKMEAIARFERAGTYVLRLVVDDGELAAIDDVTVAVEPGKVTTISRISSSEDDAEEDDDGEVDRDDDEISLATDDGDSIAAFRLAVDVPKDALIADARLQFQSEDDDSEPSVVLIRAEASADARALSDEDSDISSRPMTAASVQWNVDEWSEEGDRGPAQRTPNLAQVLQEIVSRDDWKRGNFVLLTLSGIGDRVVESFDESPESAATLHIEYIVGAPEPPKNTFVAGVGRADITPPPGIPMHGWSLIGQISEGVRTRLYARALYLESADGARMVLVQCDLGAVPAALHREVTQSIAATTGLDPSEVLISATHTHTSTTGGVPRNRATTREFCVSWRSASKRRSSVRITRGTPRP